MDISLVAFAVSAALITKRARDGSNNSCGSKDQDTSSKCPFGYSSSNIDSNINNIQAPSNLKVITGNDNAPQESASTLLSSSSSLGVKHPKDKLQDFISRSGRVINLYDLYVHFPSLKQVWDGQYTGKFDSEKITWCELPCIISGFHGIELGFILLSEFVRDPRSYVVKRPRIEQVCHDITVQFQLLATLMEGRLGDKMSKEELSKLPCCDVSAPSRPSSGLMILTNNISASLGNLNEADKNCLVAAVKTIVHSFAANFCNSASYYDIGLGIEFQMIEFASLFGIADGSIRVRSKSMDYFNIIKPNVPLSTLTSEKYEHHEDFFFRTVHLGTECWAFIAHARLKMARDLAFSRDWLAASVQIRFAAEILNYLGDHVLLLTTMILRDYLHLKVEIQGTSGEGSIAVKAFRAATLSLLDPLTKDLIDFEDSVLMSPTNEILFKDTLWNVYYKPDALPKLYDYCKALECIESALLGGFYYKHFLLASNVIGLGAKGTMNRSVKALRATFESVCFPVLDNIRSELGDSIDAELKHNHAKIMFAIEKQNPGKFPNFQITPMSTPVKPPRSAELNKALFQKCQVAELNK